MILACGLHLHGVRAWRGGLAPTWQEMPAWQGQNRGKRAGERRAWDVGWEGVVHVRFCQGRRRHALAPKNVGAHKEGVDSGLSLRAWG